MGGWVDLYMIRKNLLIIILLAISLSHAGLNYPYTGQELNYIHVLFEWDQEPDAGLYNLQVSNSESFNNVILDINDKTTVYIEKDTIAWGNMYFWRVRPIYSDNSYGEWSEVSYFITDEPISWLQSGSQYLAFHPSFLLMRIIVEGKRNRISLLMLSSRLGKHFAMLDSTVY